MTKARARRPLVVITGGTGNLGHSLGAALTSGYQVVGLDLKSADVGFPVIEADFTSDASVGRALDELRGAFGARIASVIHLVAYFDFSGEQSPLYQHVNVEGTRRLLRALQSFEVDQFVYASTMLVHAPCEPGEHIDESQPIDPRWAYPQSKAAAEAEIRKHHGAIPYVILRLAGVYDEHRTVPTVAQQIARIYDRDFRSYLYSGNTGVGQAMLHRDDLLDAVCRTVDRRATLPDETEILIGEADAIGYDTLQDELGKLIHGARDWPTLRVPKPVAAAGAWMQDRLEPLVPDAIDQGEEPFIKPFMVAMADDHYALDTTRAREMLGWRPRHRLADELPAMVADLKQDPAAWYADNKVTPPAWLAEADALDKDPDRLRIRHENAIRSDHAANRWTHFANLGFATWLVTQPLLVDVTEPALRWSEIALGVALLVFAGIALSWRAQWSRWACAAIGALVMAVPFLFSTANAAAYLSDTLVGGLIFAFAVGTRPEPGPSPVAAQLGPMVPPGWTYNPSAWTQRIPIIVLAVIGLYVSRYLAAYQLGHVPAVWDPFFAGSPLDPRNGTEEIITSKVSRAWPVSDAAVGGYTYALEILTGLVGSRMRWRTMPWLVIVFGLMIAPLGVTSILFIIIQPVVIGTWSTIALIGAAAVLVQIPYSLDELLATLQFLRRRVRAGRSWLRVFLFGDTDERGGRARGGIPADEFDRPPGVVIREMVAGGVSLTWNLGVTALIGIALLFTRVTLGADGSMANVHHVIGSLVLTVVSLAAAEVARPLRYLGIPLGAVLAAAPFLVDADTPNVVASVVAGLALVALSFRRGPVRERYGNWNRWIV